MSMMAWWDLLADLSCAIDFATDDEDLAIRIANLDPRIKYLSEVLPAETVDAGESSSIEDRHTTI